MLAILSVPGEGYAAAPVAALPGPADAGRIEQREQFQIPEAIVSPETGTPQVFPTVKPPAGSDQVTMTLSDVQIAGMTVFTLPEVQDIYARYIGQKISLDTVWAIAAELTKRYRDEGYFLSRVFVPQQKIDDGIVNLRVIEGYIGEIKFDGSLKDNRIIKQWLDKIQDYRPIKASEIESVLLHINDLPGVTLHAVLEPIDATSSSEGAVRMELEQQEVPRVSGSIGYDNSGSRFLGPNEAQVQAQAELVPTQRTTLTGLSSLPWDDMKYGSLRHELPLFAGATLELYGSVTHTAPGYTLRDEYIRSVSSMLGVAFDYSLIRQREENLTARLSFEAQDATSDILGTPLTRDYVRAFRVGLNYQRADAWDGQNALNGTLSQGANMLGASPAHQVNISRAGAVPDFTKINLDSSRLQRLSDHWHVMTAVSGQLATGPLYSTEQFGYGGQAFGRAYDNSEITGDQGIDASLELRYSGLAPLATLPPNGASPVYHLQPLPYAFYDIGAVWNLGNNPTPYASGSSAGGGVRLETDFGVTSNVGFGFPLTRAAANPISGNGKNPRYFVSVSYGF